MDLGNVFCQFMDRRCMVLAELTQLFILITFVVSALLSPYFLISSVVLIVFYIKNFRNFHPKKPNEIVEKKLFEDQDKENIRLVMEYYLFNVALKKIYSNNYIFIKYIGLVFFTVVYFYTFIF